MEVELKLLVDQQGIEKLIDLPVLQAITLGLTSVHQLKNVYFDTPDFYLWNTKAGLRVRHTDKKCVQTLKAGGSVTAGLHQREEWETDVSGEKPDIKALREAMGPHSPYVNVLASPKLFDHLEPIFKSDVTRTVRHLRLTTGDEVEMAIDQGTITYQEKSEVVSEIEFELKSGKAAHLYTFALELLECIPMRIGTRSKAERGYAMRLPQQKKIVKASKLYLNRSMTIEAAFEAIVANCMEQVKGNEQGVMYSTDSENVHQMRVGLRRLRSALGLFKNVIDCPAVIQDDLKWIASQLGAARDWEVLASSTLDHLQAVLPQDVNVDGLRKDALDWASRNREQAANAVNSSRNTRLQLQFADWVARKQWREANPASGVSLTKLSLKKIAKQVLKRGEHRLLKRGKHLQGNDPELRHETRIAGKKSSLCNRIFWFPLSKSEGQRLCIKVVRVTGRTRLAE